MDLPPLFFFFIIVILCRSVLWQTGGFKQGKVQKRNLRDEQEEVYSGYNRPERIKLKENVLEKDDKPLIATLLKTGRERERFV